MSRPLHPSKQKKTPGHDRVLHQSFDQTTIVPGMVILFWKLQHVMLLLFSSAFVRSFVPLARRPCSSSASQQAFEKLLSSPLFQSSKTRMDYKRSKLDDTVSEKVIGTHSGSFQADEAMGVWMLRQTPEYRNSKCVRSRDLKILDTLDIVIDVGGVYDHAKKRYDHHQRDYDERFDEGKEGTDGRCTKLSASGLVYRHYGKDVIKAYYPSLGAESLDLVYEKVYNTLLEALDAIDTGVEMAPDGL